MTPHLPLLPRWLRWCGVVAVAGLIFYTSIVTVPPAVAVEDEDIFTLLAEVVGFTAATWRHFLAYGTLAYALAYATDHWDLDHWQLVLVVVGSCVLYGIGIEVGQYFVPYRTFAVTDAVTNTAGASLVLPWYILRPRLELAGVSECVDRWRELFS